MRRPLVVMLLVLRGRRGVGISVAGVRLVGGQVRLDDIVGGRNAKMDVEIDGRRLRSLLLLRMRSPGGRVVGTHRDVVGRHVVVPLFSRSMEFARSAASQDFFFLPLLFFLPFAAAFSSASTSRYCRLACAMVGQPA